MKIFTPEKYSDDEILFIESEHRKEYLKLFKSTLIVQTLFPLLLCYVFLSLIDNIALFGWLASILLITLLRGCLTYGWYRNKPTASNVILFEKLSLVLSFMAGCLWGITVLVMDFNQYPEASVFLNIIIFGLAAGSVGIGSYWFEYFLTYNLTVFSIYIFGYLFAISEPYYLLVISLSIFVIFLSQIVLVFHRGNAQNIWLSKRNEKLAENLVHKKQEAETIAASRTRLLASASHDLRQPLQALNFFLSVFYSELTSDKSRKIYFQLEKCVDGMNELLNSILDLSKLDAQVVALNNQPCCLNTILDNLKEQFQIQADQKGLELIFHPCSDYIYSDAILLKRILSNLISNAINYTQTGKVEVVSIKDDGLQIQVIDTGSGLTTIEQEQIFEEFFQLNNPERDKNKGFGVGLSIVKRLCKLMNIPMKIYSEKGKGSRFTLFLPICDAPPQRELQHISPQDITINKKILIIEDEMAIRESLSQLLSQWQCQVIAVDSANAACEVITSTQYIPDLVIADYRLRENKTGIQAIDKVKTLLNQALLPAIIISGDTEPSRLKEVASSGYELLHKPVKPAYLRMLIQQNLM